MMENNIETNDFEKRRTQKNWVVLSIILSCVALIWGTTLLKLQALPKNSPFHQNVEKIEAQK